MKVITTVDNYNDSSSNSSFNESQNLSETQSF